MASKKPEYASMAAKIDDTSITLPMFELIAIPLLDSTRNITLHGVNP